MNDVTKDLLERISDIAQMYERFGATCVFEGQPMMHLSHLEEIAELATRAEADGWINPNDKTRKQYLPHIGEKVLFCHAGITYYGKHTGGSFQSFNPPRTFGTWDCLWMYPPKAREAQP